MAEKDFEWLTPLLGFIGLLAGSLFLSNPSKNYTWLPPPSTPNNNNLPPPPPNQKPSGCGCTANNRNNR